MTQAPGPGTPPPSAPAGSPSGANGQQPAAPAPGESKEGPPPASPSSPPPAEAGQPQPDTPETQPSPGTPAVGSPDQQGPSTADAAAAAQIEPPSAGLTALSHLSESIGEMKKKSETEQLAKDIERKLSEAAQKSGIPALIESSPQVGEEFDKYFQQIMQTEEVQAEIKAIEQLPQDQQQARRDALEGAARANALLAFTINLLNNPGQREQLGIPENDPLVVAMREVMSDVKNHEQQILADAEADPQGEGVRSAVEDIQNAAKQGKDVTQMLRDFKERYDGLPTAKKTLVWIMLITNLLSIVGFICPPAVPIIVGIQIAPMLVGAMARIDKVVVPKGIPETIAGKTPVVNRLIRQKPTAHAEEEGPASTVKEGDEPPSDPNVAAPAVDVAPADATTTPDAGSASDASPAAQSEPSGTSAAATPDAQPEDSTAQPAAAPPTTPPSGSGTGGTTA